MSESNGKNIALSFIVAYMGSIVSVFGIFLITMLVQYRQLDPAYLESALPRILMLSIVPGVLGILLSKRRKIAHFMIGVLVGPLIGAVYVVLKIGMS
jgi:hypothetical protein